MYWQVYGRNREIPAYATKQDAQKYLVKRVCNLKGFEVVTENEKEFRNTSRTIVDVYACDIITDEFSVQETLLILRA
jgi:hypothetical protein